MNLFISTATNKIHVILFSENQVIKNLMHEGNNNHSVYLYKLLDEVDINQVQNVYLVNGPGSFTGLRVASIFVKSLQKKQAINVYPVNLLELFYLMNNNQPVCLDARGKKYFYYDVIETKIIKLDEITDDMLIVDELEDKNIINFLSGFKLDNDFEINYGKRALWLQDIVT